MKKGILMIILIAASLSLTGCYMIKCDKHNYGYVISLKTAQVSFDDFKKLDTLLKNNGFSGGDEEKKDAVSRGIENDRYISYSKKLSLKEHPYVEVYIFYLKNQQDLSIQQLEIRVENSYRGAVNPAIKSVIEHDADLIYQYLNTITNNSVTIEKEIVTPPYCI